MAQPFKVDIFSEDIDVVGPNVKPPIPPLLPYLNTNKPIPVKCGPANLKKVPVIFKQAPVNFKRVPVKQKQLITKLKKTTKKKKAKTPIAKPKFLDSTKQQPVGWLPIPALGGPETPTTRQAVKKGSVNVGMERPNLKVVENTAGDLKLNLDTPKGASVQEKPVTPTEKGNLNPDPPKASSGVTNPAPKPQSSGVMGRMTASAFMNIDHQQARFRFLNMPNISIPRSFLNKEHMQQLQTSTKQTATNPSTQDPVWEAKVPTSNTSTASWTAVSRSDPLPSGQYTPTSGQPIRQESQSYQQSYGPSGSGGQGYGAEKSLFVQTDSNMDKINTQYSPSDTYADMISESNEIPGEFLDSLQSGLKRLSAFQRLGPVTQPKKPKLTINLLVGKEQAVREVVDESENPESDKYMPVIERADIQTSLDDTVMKYLALWPWKKSSPVVRRTVSARESKHVMQVELEQMDEHYEKDKLFFGILVTGYPESWNKNDVLGAILEAVKGKSFIPCFIEFAKHECKFLILRSRPALLAIHKMGFSYRKDDVVLNISIMHLNLSVNQIDFIPRLILRKRLSMSMDNETVLNLKQFTLAPDVSHFLYFPLDRVANQVELMQLQSSVPWQALTKLVLSHNNITTLSGFDLPNRTPRLKHLDLSYNRIDGVTSLLALRELPLTSLVLEGNPLCSDYIDPERYAKVLKMMFSGLREIDGVKLRVPGEFPPSKRNYCPPEAQEVAARVLETMFPLLDAGAEERRLVEDLYMDDAVMTITYMYKLRYGPIFKDYRTLFSRARVMDEGEMDAIEGAPAIAKIISRWPKLEHDPLTFTVDVLHHADATTILRISGIMKVAPESLAEDEHLLHFTRTLVLHSLDSREYRITNEMVYWDLPDRERARDAFCVTTVRSKNLNLKLDGPPDAELKEKLLEIFMMITDLHRKPSERCLERKDWHLRNAIEHFTKLLKMDNLDSLFD